MNLDEFIASIEALRRRPRERSVKKLVRPRAAIRNSRVLYLITKEDEDEKQREETTRKRPSGEGTLRTMHEGADRPFDRTIRYMFLLKWLNSLPTPTRSRSQLNNTSAVVRRRRLGDEHSCILLGPYRPVRTGLASDRYADRPLLGGTAKIDRRRSIEEEKGKRKKKKKRKRRKKKKKNLARVLSLPTGRPCVLAARGRLFSPRWERDRGDATNQGKVVDSNITKYSVKVLPVSL
ncbi:hypothetical protein GW17_00004772 [Ensete ventricosum]|nr:hypothetical protein GW17_00004772 [Ensete ventricosum]